MTNVNEIINLWKEEEPKYKNLGVIVSDFIQKQITDYELLPEIQYRTKDLISIIKKIKKKQEKKHYTFQDLKDKLGFRIICLFQEDMKEIEKFISENFKIINIEHKKDNLDFNTLNYVSDHYDVKINTCIEEFSDKKLLDLEHYIFEIQVRTLNQHAWSNTSHSLSYKQEQELPPILKRKIYRLLSLYELADDEFSSVNKALKENGNDMAFSIFRKLEGKFYKYAKIDFDRETSLNTINTILSFTEEEYKSDLIIKIEKFIKDNESKISSIYSENRNRFFEIIFLTQPEIFLIWYMLDSQPYTIEDNWENHFYTDDLEQIKTLWGSNL